MTTDCRDEEARATIRTVRDEMSTSVGELMGEVGHLHDRMRHLAEFLGAPAYVRAHLNGSRPPSFADLVDEVTDHGRKSHPVRAAIERLTGKLVVRLVLFVTGAGAALLIEHGIMALLKGHP